LLLTLSEPDAVSSDERVLVYGRARDSAWWAMGLPGGGVIEGRVKDIHFLRVEMDEHGIVRRREVTAETGYDSGHGHAHNRYNPNQHKLNQVVGKSAAINGEEVKISARADWYSGSLLSRPKGGTLYLSETKLSYLS